MQVNLDYCGVDFCRSSQNNQDSSELYGVSVAKAIFYETDSLESTCEWTMSLVGFCHAGRPGLGGT
jgi:hypothetical protein